MNNTIDTSEVKGSTLWVNLDYPLHNSVNTIQIDLCDVRASDGIQIKYDFDRDGWVILQASIFEFCGDDTECDSDWQEVAFVESWGREVKE